MGLIEILVKRELTLECLQLSSINPLLNNACMPTLKCKLNEVLKISCMSDNNGYFQNGAHLAPPSPIQTFMHTFMNSYIKNKPPIITLTTDKGENDIHLFIQSGYFYSASLSQLLIRGAPDHSN